jgi:hypothetical protein
VLTTAVVVPGAVARALATALVALGLLLCPHAPAVSAAAPAPSATVTESLTPDDDDYDGRGGYGLAPMVALTGSIVVVAGALVVVTRRRKAGRDGAPRP